MRLIQIVPKDGFNLYGALVKKELHLRQGNQGTFRRGGPKQRSYAKWHHTSYNGWIWLERTYGKVVTAVLQCKAEGDEWQVFHAFIGFLDRHFARKIKAINIQYE